MIRVVVLAIEGALASSLVLPIEMLRAAAQHARAHSRQAPGLEVRVAAEQREVLTMSGVISLKADLAADAVQEAELIIVPSLWRAPAATVERHPRIGRALRRAARSGTRLCSVGTGSYFPAAAGLLDGRQATTHWSFFDDFARRFPAVQLQRRHLITRSGPFYCAASVNSAADLTLHFIGEFFGAAAARQVESQFSPEIRRPFGSHSLGEAESGAHPDEAIRMAQDWLLANPGAKLRVPELAARCGLGTRTFNRRFRTAVGTTPLVFLREARLELARDLLRQSNLGIGEIAHRCGYPDPGHFSRAFSGATGSSPQEYRSRARGKLFRGGQPRSP
jgi:transcriptional regulator GlxA family with amidase domain